MDLSESEYDTIARSACFVCRIVQGTPLLPNPRVVYEDDRVIGFLNQLPTQEGYTIVAPKRHVERFEQDLAEDDWLHLQRVTRNVARAVAEATGASRMYLASLGSPERNPHIHLHVCPCPPGTPFDQQQFAAMQWPKGGGPLRLTDERMDTLARRITVNLGIGGPSGVP